MSPSPCSSIRTSSWWTARWSSSRKSCEGPTASWPRPCCCPTARARTAPRREPSGRDRKSTRLNSSHSQNSYAVFCLKKKNDICPVNVAEDVARLNAGGGSRRAVEQADDGDLDGFVVGVDDHADAVELDRTVAVDEIV